MTCSKERAEAARVRAFYCLSLEGRDAALARGDAALARGARRKHRGYSGFNLSAKRSSSLGLSSCLSSSLSLGSCLSISCSLSSSSCFSCLCLLLLCDGGDRCRGLSSKGCRYRLCNGGSQSSNDLGHKLRLTGLADGGA